ncbi:MAG TPA: citrate synthase, partial [Prochlorococcaceae cyanobacterium Fu_MAG_134]|nr:citrate synthase [Prochlorococcaceae cyanobacterium Fu_MAG_134]
MGQEPVGEIHHDRSGIVFRPGLEGVPVTQSAICDIDGLQGSLTYRGYPVEDLAAHSTFLETTYLLIWGDLPSPRQLRDFEAEVQMHRRVSFRVRDMMKCFPATGHPMDALQSSAASLGLFYSRRAIDNPKYVYEAVVRLIAKIPTMVAAFKLIRKGQDPIQPRDDLAYSANFLYMLTEREPDPLAARIFDRCLILHAEHSLNASTFSARVTASTLTDPYAVVASAVGTLAGPLHGGANEDVLAMLEEIGSPERAGEYLDEAIASKRKIMGFGHREYRVKDPRAVILQGLAEELFARFGKDEMYDVARALEHEAAERLG